MLEHSFWSSQVIARCLPILTFQEVSLYFIRFNNQNQHIAPITVGCHHSAFHSEYSLKCVIFQYLAECCSFASLKSKASLEKFNFNRESRRVLETTTWHFQWTDISWGTWDFHANWHGDTLRVATTFQNNPWEKKQLCYYNNNSRLHVEWNRGNLLLCLKWFNLRFHFDIFNIYWNTIAGFYWDDVISLYHFSSFYSLFTFFNEKFSRKVLPEAIQIERINRK